MAQLPIYIDSFLSPVRDNQVAQVAVVAVLVLILLDVLFGVVDACRRRQFSSSRFREGLTHKCGELGMLLVGIVTDGMLVGGFDLGIAPVFPTLCLGLCIMEIASLCELCAKMNPDLARIPVFKLLEHLHEGALEDLPDEVQERAERRDDDDEEA